MASARQMIRLADTTGRQSDTGPAPIPDGVRVGNLVFSSLLPASRDPGTNAHLTDPDQQAASLFRNVRSFMERAGGSPDNITQLTVYMQDERYRHAINQQWVEMFPNADDRPARIVVYRDFGTSGLFFEVSLIAVL